MKVDQFNYELPKELIAKSPVEPSDSARMLVVKNSIKDYIIKDLPNFLSENDILVFNDTRVIPARLIGFQEKTKIEITLIKEVNQKHWRAFAKPARRVKVGCQIIFSPKFKADILKRNGQEVDLLFNFNREEFFDNLDLHGKMPLPPYIKRSEDYNDSDRENYQTIYAKEPGAIAAPTAGLHFTTDLFDEIQRKKIKYVFTTLHVGAGTFAPVKVEDTDNHVMHSEHYRIDETAVDAIEEARNKGGRVVAVGTTSLRVLESSTDISGKLVPTKGITNLFIVPGYKFKVVDILLTNFHLPRSTLLMLVSAFIGSDKTKLVYSYAIEKKYRFFSYGDACLLYKKE
tara:strand:- start:2010 stop:3038 length:1029 start_codon:yes stop_codon:yes gene_type:complete